MELKATFCLCAYTLASLNLKIMLQLSPSSSSSSPTYAQAISSEMRQPTYKCNIACFLGFVFNVYNIIIIKDIVCPLSYQEKFLQFSKKNTQKHCFAFHVLLLRLNQFIIF
jgi:hypothetical protein